MIFKYFPAEISHELFQDAIKGAQTCDLIIKCGRNLEEHHGHRIILASCSQFLSEALSSATPGTIVVFILPDIHPQTMKQILSYIYTGEIHLESKADYEKFLEGCRLLQIPEGINVKKDLDDDCNSYFADDEDECENEQFSDAGQEISEPEEEASIYAQKSKRVKKIRIEKTVIKTIEHRKDKKRGKKRKLDEIGNPQNNSNDLPADEVQQSSLEMNDDMYVDTENPQNDEIQQNSPETIQDSEVETDEFQIEIKQTSPKKMKISQFVKENNVVHEESPESYSGAKKEKKTRVKKEKSPKEYLQRVRKLVEKEYSKISENQKKDMKLNLKDILASIKLNLYTSTNGKIKYNCGFCKKELGIPIHEDASFNMFNFRIHLKTKHDIDIIGNRKVHIR